MAPRDLQLDLRDGRRQQPFEPVGTPFRFGKGGALVKPRVAQPLVARGVRRCGSSHLHSFVLSPWRFMRSGRDAIKPVLVLLRSSLAAARRSYPANDGGLLQARARPRGSAEPWPKRSTV